MTDLVQLPDETTISSNGHSEKPQQPATISFSVYAKIAQVYRKLRAAHKDGTNDGQGNWTYASIDEITQQVRPLMGEAGLILIPSMLDYDLKREGKMERAAANFEFKLVDADTGQFEIMRWAGIANDYSDKALNKAASFALKELLKKLFLISSTDDDPDKHDIQNNDNRQSAPPANNKPNSRPQQNNSSQKSTQSWWQDGSKLNFVAKWAFDKGYTGKVDIQEVLSLLGLQNVSDLKKFKSGENCGNAIKETAQSLSNADKAETWGVSSKVRYNSKYISFPDIAGTPRWYAGRTQLAEQVGEVFAAKYNIAEWDTDEDGKPQTFTFADDPLYVRHEPAKSGKYNQVVEIKLAPTEAEHNASDKPDFDDIEAYFDKDEAAQDDVPPADEEAPEPPETYEDVPF